jgi:hypothetical protein
MSRKVEVLRPHPSEEGMQRGANDESLKLLVAPVVIGQARGARLIPSQGSSLCVATDLPGCVDQPQGRRICARLRSYGIVDRADLKAALERAEQHERARQHRHNLGHNEPSGAESDIRRNQVSAVN